MTLARVAPPALLLTFGFLGVAWAQFPPQNAPPCMNEFLPIRAEAEKRAGILKAGIEKKRPPQELCHLFRSFSEAEAKLVKYATTNQATCNIPAEAVTAMKTSHGKTVQIRDKVCATATAPPKQAGPNLGDALGTRNFPTSDTTTTGRGTLDTLTGNPLAR